MDALLWYSIAIALLGGLGVAGRWADRHVARGGHHKSVAQIILQIALGAYYLAFAFGVATLLYILATGTAPSIR